MTAVEKMTPEMPGGPAAAAGPYGWRWPIRTIALAAAMAMTVGGVALSVGEARCEAVAIGVASALALGIAACALLSRVLVAVTVRGVSMERTYRDGDRVLVRRKGVAAVGRVIVVERPVRGMRSPHDGVAWDASALSQWAGSRGVEGRCWMIKRVAAVAGDPVPRDRAPALAGVPEQCVPQGKVVLMGDNAAASLDSRQVGYFPVERILGTVVRRLSR